ncbi:FxLYD domain-containing protein [Alteribacillus sp. YIM 98480]|uniref:FxLYD domain-containing protein n=1 Tax=Alteribacillus sp. YIM 98480 TaxID=2606599 RepID=UPI00131AC71D|nr:FxLYD domain-containing protein [Alteribacillus sp. YIM 98480]
MICKTCKSKNVENSKFCSNCGAELTERKTRYSVSSVSNSWKAFCFVLPLLFFLGGGTFLFFAYEKEQSINQDVLQLQEKMITAMRDGEIEEALTLNEQAMAYRPKENALQEDQKQLEEAADWFNEQEAVLNQIGDLEFDKAAQDAASLSEQAAAFNEPLAGVLDMSLQETETILYLARTREEIKALESVEELGSRLSSLEDYDGEEAEALVNDIHSRMEGISYDQASRLLSEGNINGAQQTLNQGLDYLPESERLLSLQDKVEQEKLAAEQAKQAQKEQQLMQAAAEDHENETEAAEILNLDASIDDFGDLNIEGEVENNGTAPISDIQVTLSVYEEDEYLGETYMDVLPYQLQPGETGSFFDFYIGPYEEVDVEIENINWYVN